MLLLQLMMLWLRLLLLCAVVWFVLLRAPALGRIRELGATLLAAGARSAAAYVAAACAFLSQRLLVWSCLRRFLAAVASA